MRKLIAATFVIALLGGCSSDDSDDAATSTTVTVPSSGLTTSTSGSSGGGTTSTPAAKPVKFSSAEKAAAHLFNAWRTGNRNQALEVAEPSVVDTLFSHPLNGPAPSFEGCEQQPPDRFICAYRYEGGGMMFRVQTDDAIGYRVIAVDYVAD